MGALLDTTIFVYLERTVRTQPRQPRHGEISTRLEEQLGPDDISSRALPSGYFKGASISRWR